jgi:hypothetical protein
MDDDVLGRKEETKLERDDDEADGTEYTLVRWGLVPMAESGRSRTKYRRVSIHEATRPVQRGRTVGQPRMSTRDSFQHLNKPQRRSEGRR